MSKVEEPEISDESEDEDYKPEEEEAKSEESDDNSEVSDGEEESRTRKKRSKKLKKSQPDEDQEANGSKEETAEDEKKRSDALWADFLSDVDPPPARKSKEDSSPEDSSSSASKEYAEKATAKKNIEEEKKVPEVVERVFDFAGEEVRVPVVENSEKATKRPASASTNIPRSSRGVSGGLAAVLGSIGKKPKISTLEKSKLDWNQFKQSQGINEEIERFNKGKDGYLERQDFLERTDYRQFDIERDMRQKKRSSR
ncbi:hypothetical protein DMENIID0001_109160 [Sergentomyia squamirostris]